MMLSILTSPCFCFYATWEMKDVFSRHSVTHLGNQTSQTH